MRDELGNLSETVHYIDMACLVSCSEGNSLELNDVILRCVLYSSWLLDTISGTLYIWFGVGIHNIELADAYILRMQYL